MTIDWTRYVDEDEEKGGFDVSGMGGGMNFGGGMGDDDMGGMGVRAAAAGAARRAPARARKTRPPWLAPHSLVPPSPCPFLRARACRA